MNINKDKWILVTGAAGFIGFHVCKKLLDEGFGVIGIDNFDPYYDIDLKMSRIQVLKKSRNFVFQKIDLCDKERLESVLSKSPIEVVIHLAAQAGVRHSFTHPKAYIDNNIVATYNLLEVLKSMEIKNFLFSSTSSVYGDTGGVKCNEEMGANKPTSLYAATKKGCEAMIHSYAHLYSFNTTIIRFFTVYGPFGRPDMALFKFTKAILEGEEIQVHNSGKMSRDFTYVGDLVDSLFRLLHFPSNYQIINLGNSKPIQLTEYISILENLLGKTAKKTFLDMQPGEVKDTHADNSVLKNIIGELQYTDTAKGISEFVSWYKGYYR